MTIHKAPIKKYNIVIRKSTSSRIPLAVKAPTIVGGRIRKNTPRKKRKSMKGGGSDPYGRDDATIQMGDKIWEVIEPLLEHADGIFPQTLNTIKDLIYRGCWDAITDQIRPQMGSSAAQFFSHIPIIGAPLANISNIIGGL